MIQWIKTHPLVLLLAAAAVFTFDWLLINKKRLKMKWFAALILAILHVICGVGCVKLFALAEAGFNAEKAGNMSLFGSIFFLPLPYFIGAKLFKRSTADVFDSFTVPMVFTLMCARVNCFFGGCCLGRLIGKTGSRWPTREAELVFYAVFLAVIIPMVFNGRRRGMAFPLFMVSYGVFRFAVEFFRESAAYPGIFHLSHLWALLSVVIGAVAYILLRRKRPLRAGKDKAVKTLK